MLMCPYLCFAWHLLTLLTYLYPVVTPQQVRLTIYHYYLRMFIFFFVRAPGLKVHLYGDVKEVTERDENVIYMSNHQSSMDWLVAYTLAMRARCMSRVKFMMKQELHWVPIVGYYLKLLGHIYVRRRGFRQDKLIEIVRRVATEKTPVWLGIFPEGTRYNPEDQNAIAVSEKYANMANQPVLKHQLTPRPKGSWLMVENLRSHLDAVYSVTLVYEQPEPKGHRSKPPSASDVLRGACSNVHVHIKRIPIEDVPKDEASFAPWLHDVFVQRDSLLSSYYSTRSFASWGPSELEDLSRDSMASHLLVALAMVLGLALLPSVRSLYLLTALTASIWGWIHLAVDPPF